MQHSVTLLLVLTVLGAFTSIQAVVHGIQPAHNRYDLSTDNRNGYRYNGPAHKYLPAAGAPATEAVTATTGHWQPNPLLVQQPPYEHTFSSKPMSQQGYNGPYSMQYYEREPQQQQQQQQSGNSWRQQTTQKLQPLSGSAWAEPQLSGNAKQQPQQMYEQQLSGNSWRQQPQLSGNAWQQQQNGGRQQQHNNLNTFPYVSEHNKIPATTAGMAQFGASYSLSGATHHNSLLESHMRADPLMNQALPERYQQQLFASPDSAMRVPNYEQQLAGAAGDYLQMQSHSYELPSSYHTQREYAEQQSRPQKDYEQQKPDNVHHYVVQAQEQPDYYRDHAHSASASSSSSFPSSSSSYSSSSFPSSSSLHSSHLTYQPSREFQAPYY